jgi:hypothetical protein
LLDRGNQQRGFAIFPFGGAPPAATGLHKFSENTTLRDTPENRTTLTKQAAMIGAEIAANRFD